MRPEDPRPVGDEAPADGVGTGAGEEAVGGATEREEDTGEAAMGDQATDRDAVDRDSTVGLMQEGDRAPALPLAVPSEAFVEVLVDVASEDPRLVVLTADRARECGLQPFADAYSDRFFNLGSADRNLIGTAAGMAAAGKLPVVVTAGVSAALIAFDLIRDIVARSSLQVVIAAVPAGIESRFGGVQHALEDLALMTSVPGLKVVAPADSVQTGDAARALLTTPGPSYLRLLGEALPVILDESHAFELGSALTLREGSDVTLIATGALTAEALAAAAALEREGVSARMVNVHTLKPLDAPAIRRAAKETGAVVVCEEHYLNGGLGAAVAQEIGRSHPVPIEFVAVEDRFVSGGSPEALRDALHLRGAAIVEAAKRLREKRR